MPVKTCPDALNNAIEMYRSGSTVKQCSEITGISESVLYQRFSSMGLTTERVKFQKEERDKRCRRAFDLVEKGFSTKDAVLEAGITYDVFQRYCKRNGINLPGKHGVAIANIDTAQIIPLFDAGVGVAGVAKRLGTSPTVIAKYLAEKGFHLRNRSEQQAARMQSSTPDQIAKLTAKAHEAARNRTVSKEERIKSALTREGKPDSRSKYDAAVFEIISQKYPEAIASKAIDVYNADIAIGPVTVEVFGGGWSITDRSRVSRYIKRCKEIGEFGFHTIFFMVMKDSWLSDASELISTIDIASRYPTSPSQYWVVWGNRQGSSGLCSQLNHSAFVSPFINVRDPATGQYVSVPR